MTTGDLDETRDWPVIRLTDPEPAEGPGEDPDPDPDLSVIGGFTGTAEPAARAGRSARLVWGGLALLGLVVVGGWLALTLTQGPSTNADVVVFSPSPSVQPSASDGSTGSATPPDGAVSADLVGISRGGSSQSGAVVAGGGTAAGPSGSGTLVATSSQATGTGGRPTGAPAKPPSRQTSAPPSTTRPTGAPSSTTHPTPAPTRSTTPPTTAPSSTTTTVPPTTSTVPPTTTTVPPAPVTVTVDRLPAPVRCAYEGQRCALPSTATLIYGMNQRYAYQWHVSGNLACGNAAFGFDPIPKTFKSCWAAPEAFCGMDGQRCAPPPGVTYIAEYLRNGALSIRGPQSGPFDCTGPTFGQPATSGAYCVVTAISP